MALESATTAINMLELQETATKTAIAKVLAELQNINFFVADGAAAEADITVTGIGLTDTVLAVMNLPVDGNVDDLTVMDVAEVSITAADTIQLSTTATTGDKLLVIYLAKP